MAINTNNVSRKVLSAIEKAMNRTDRRLFKEGKAYVFVIIKRNKALKRWGNEANFVLTSPCGALGRNSLVSCAYDNNWKEAKNALEYFVYGDKNEYKITVYIAEKGDYPWQAWTTPVCKEDAERVLTDTFGTKIELVGTNFVFTNSPTLRSVSYETEEEIVEYNLDDLKSRHSGIEEGCFFSDWE